MPESERIQGLAVHSERSYNCIDQERLLVRFTCLTNSLTNNSTNNSTNDSANRSTNNLTNIIPPTTAQDAI